MKKIINYSLSILTLSLGLMGCSNLDDSIFNPENTTEEDIIYSETFESGMGDFKQYSVDGDQTWEYNSSGYMIMTGYESPSYYANEDWLISPEIDLSNVSAANLTFDYVARYFSDASNEATVWVSDDYVQGGDPEQSTWVQIQTVPFSDPGSWPTVFPSSEELSLTQFAGKKVYVAFKYTSTDTKAGTWELKNFLIKKGEASVSEKLLYTNSFGSSKGDFTAISVNGTQTWAYSSTYSCMAISGYSSGYFANEDWLVSPEIDLSSVNNAYVSFDHAGRYFGTPANEATVWVSEDYTDSASFSTATWTKLSVMNYFSNTAFTFVSSGKLDLSAYIGKKIHVALKYTSTTSVAGTWEVRNFSVYDGKASGNEDVPFTVSQAVESQSGGAAWVEGYVVGYAWPFKSQYAYYFNADSCSQVANVLLADSLHGLYTSGCVALQLPRGTLRSVVNLKDNSSIYGTKIKVYGTLSSYLGIAGIINPTKYVLADGTTGTVSINTVFSETFGSSLGSFTSENVTGTQYWKFASGYGASMSGYSSGAYANEDWLISPEIDLTNITSAALSFDHTINKGVVANMQSEQTLWISTDSGATWNQLTIPTYPTGSSWTFVNSGEISLDKYVGSKVKIAFKYISTTASAATWEINDFIVYY